MATLWRGTRRLLRGRNALLIGFLGMTLSLGLSTTGTQAATASSSQPGPSGPVLSTYENALRSVSRDGGTSVPLPHGKDLWIFGDTAIFQSTGSGRMLPAGFITGGTAAEGPYTAGKAPTSLAEVSTPGQGTSSSAGNPPAPFMPAPDVYLPDGSGRRCTPAPGQYPARWATGAALLPDNRDVLITFSDTCVTDGHTFRAEGWGFMEYNWTTNSLDVAPRDVFPPSPSGAPLESDLILGNPVISQGRVSLFSAVCTALIGECGLGQVYFTNLSTSLASLANSASYHVLPTATDGSTTWHPAGIAVTSYPDAPYRMIEMTSVGGTFDVLTAATPVGPWHLESSGTVPGCQSLSSGFCYALAGHPELSTPSQLAITYFDPGAGPMGTSPMGTNGPIGHVLVTSTGYGAPLPTVAAPAAS